MPTTNPLYENQTCDVCVVGAGLAGLTTAYMLAKEGKKVVVLEARNIGSGESGRTAGFLSNTLAGDYTQLTSLFGKESARLIYQSHSSAIDKLEHLADKADIDCDFSRVDGYIVAHNREQESHLLNELEALQALGWHDVVLRKRGPLESLSPLPALHFPNQARFNPPKYLAGIAKAFMDEGGRIFTNSRAVDFKQGAVLTVMTADGHAVSANHLVMATNAPVNERGGLQTKLAPYRTYMIAFSIPAGAVPDALYWDIEAPNHYMRLIKGEAQDDNAAANDILLVGGADHKTGQAEFTARHLLELEEWTRLRFPMVKEALYEWSAQVTEPLDGLPYIGRSGSDAGNEYVVAGSSGHGSSHAFIGAMVLTDLIMERTNAWAALYDPSRLKLKSAGDYLKKYLSTAAQMKEYVTPGEVDDMMEVMPGTGRIIRDGMKKIAVYCDPDGARHQSSATCTYMSCIVNWNSVENSWDCPCHGCRYDPYGKVISGPATKDLGPI